MKTLSCKQDYQEAVSKEVEMFLEDYKDNLAEGESYHDLISEVADNSEYTIYNRYHDSILYYSENADAYKEVGTDLNDLDSASSVIASMAYWAFRQDLTTELEKTLEVMSQCEKCNKFVSSGQIYSKEIDSADLCSECIEGN